MRRVVLISSILVVALLSFGGAWWIRVTATHEQRTLARLLDAKAVKDTSHIKLVYSTGFLRENKHVFECPATCILDEACGGITYEDLKLSDPATQGLFEQVRQLMESNVHPDIDWITATVSSVDRVMHRPKRKLPTPALSRITRTLTRRACARPSASTTDREERL